MASEYLPVTRELRIPMTEIAVRTSRSSGPGGQHANVTASRVQVTFDVLDSQSLSDEQRRRIVSRVGARITAVAQDSRGQARNRELALERLAERLRAAMATPRARRPTRPSRAARERRMTMKRTRSDRKRDRRPPESE